MSRRQYSRALEVTDPFGRFRFSRNHQVDALHTIRRGTLGEFQRVEGRRFSALKYGDPQSIRYFAQRLAARIWRRHGFRMLKERSAFCIVSPAYRHIPTAAVLLSEKTNEELRTQYGVHVEQVYLSRRELAAGDFGKLKSKEAREAQISGNFCVHAGTIAGRTAIFIEDALVSGTHYLETQRVLVEEGGVRLEDLHAYFIVDVRTEDFATESCGMEDVLNHLWIGPSDIHRLTEVLGSCDEQITPRMVKLLLANQLHETLPVLKKLDSYSLLGILHVADRESLSERGEYREAAACLRHYIRHRIRAHKETAALNHVYSLNEYTRDEFLHAKRIPHALLGRRVALGELYSLLKHGDAEAANFFARELAAAIAREVPLRSRMWSMAYMGYGYGSCAAGMLARNVARALDLPVIEVAREHSPSSFAGKIGDARLFRKHFEKGAYSIRGEPTAGIILVEDCVLQQCDGELVRKILGADVRTVSSWALVNSDIPALDVVEELNAALLDDRNTEMLFEVMSTADSIVVVRSCKALLRNEKKRLRKYFEACGLDRLVEIFNVARQNRLDRSAPLAEGFECLEEVLNARVRRRKTGALPPYTVLSVVDEVTGTGLMRQVGPRYSRLKYGDIEALDYFSRELVEDITRRLGSSIRSCPTDWVVAATHYFRVDNAASNLGRRVANALQLPLADIRRRAIYEGEFGALGTHAERRAVIGGNAYCSTPHVVDGKRVIYIDDAIVSGTHLEEHMRALCDAGAESVHTFALTDVAAPNLSVEKLLNYSAIGGVEDISAILHDENAPLLTRTMKYLFKLPSAELNGVLRVLPDSRLFELAEKGKLEGYDREDSMRVNYGVVEAAARDRHATCMVPDAELVRTDYALMLFDYDETLAPTLTPLAEEVTEKLVYLLSRGVHIGIISLQPIGERGLTEYALPPIVKHVMEHGLDPALLCNLHLIPSEGGRAYRVDRKGEVDFAKPEYNLTFQDFEWRKLLDIALSGPAGKLSTKHYDRDGYLSLHFKDAADLETALTSLTDSFADFEPRVEIRRKKTHDPNKYVLHIKAAGISKAIGRTYLMDLVDREMHERTGRKLERARVLVAGDRMGVTPGNDDDAKMFVLGGVNIALGQETMPGAYGTFQGAGPAGTLQLLADVCNAMKILANSGEVGVPRSARNPHEVTGTERVTDAREEAI